MARTKKPLTAVFLDQNPKPGKYYDEHGLVVIVRKNGTIYIEQRYTRRGKRRTIPIGRYPELSLSGARAQALAHLRLVHAGKDPVAERNRPPTPTLAEAIATVIEHRRAGWSNPKTEKDRLHALETAIFPKHGNRPVSDISPNDLGSVLKPIMKDAPSTVRRLRQVLSVVMHWAIVNGFREDNPADERLTKALPKRSRKTEHHQALPHSQVADALAAIRSADAWISVRLGLEFWTRSGRPISSFSLWRLLRALGIKAVPNGFRSSFRDWCAETGVSQEVAEACIASPIWSSPIAGPTSLRTRARSWRTGARTSAHPRPRPGDDLRARR